MFFLFKTTQTDKNHRWETTSSHLCKQKEYTIFVVHYDTFVLVREECLEPDKDLQRTISAEELLMDIKDNIRTTFRKRVKKWKYYFFPK